MSRKTLTEEDINNIVYFWEERGDLERFTNWIRLVPILESQYPQVLKAWNDYKLAGKTLDLLIKGLSHELL